MEDIYLRLARYFYTLIAFMICTENVDQNINYPFVKKYLENLIH